MVDDAFVNADHLGFVVVRDHPKDLLESLQSWKLIATKKPVKSDDR
jgi:hypothetical protein